MAPPGSSQLCRSNGVDVHQGGEAEEEGGIMDVVQHRGRLFHLLDTIATSPNTTV